MRRVFDGRDLGDDNTLALNAALRFEPTAAFKLTLRGDFTQEDENGSPFVFAGVNARAPVPAIVSVAAGCPGATIPFAPVAPGDPRFGPSNVPLSDDPRCANDLWALMDFGRLTGVAGWYYFSEETDDRLSVPLAFPPRQR